jgi:D-amino-acid dehydrogenase
MADPKNVIVIGGGIVGVSAASFLLRDGHKVTLLDPEGFAEKTSFGNAGAISPGACVPLAMPGMFRHVPSWLMNPEGPLTIRPSYFPRVLPWLIRFSLSARQSRIAAISDAMLALHRQVFDCYTPLLKDAGGEDLIRRNGVLYVYATEESFQASMGEVELRRAHGNNVQLLNQPEIKQLEPSIADKYRWAMFIPEHGHTVSPHRLVNTLAQQYLRDGGKYQKVAARSFERKDGKVSGVVTEAGTLPADDVVVAAGVWSRKLVNQLDFDLPLEDERGYHVTLTDSGVAPRHCVSVSDGKFMATPMEMGIRVAGTVEFAGIEAAPNWKRARVLLDQIKELYPAARIEKFTEWMGHRPSLPDSLPAIGRLPGHANVFAAFGHAHNGMTGGPPTGRAIADLIAGRQPKFDLAPYRPDRF